MTRDQQLIIEGLKKGLSQKEIRIRYLNSRSTGNVSNHLKRLMQKFDCKNVFQLGYKLAKLEA